MAGPAHQRNTNPSTEPTGAEPFTVLDFYKCERGQGYFTIAINLPPNPDPETVKSLMSLGERLKHSDLDFKKEGSVYTDIINAIKQAGVTAGLDRLPFWINMVLVEKIPNILDYNILGLQTDKEKGNLELIAERMKAATNAKSATIRIAVEHGVLLMEVTQPNAYNGKEDWDLRHECLQDKKLEDTNGRGLLIIGSVFRDRQESESGRKQRYSTPLSELSKIPFSND